MNITDETRAAAVAEWTIREAISLVGNRIAGTLQHGDRDIADRLPGELEDSLADDQRMTDLFDALWPDDPTEDHEHSAASAESCLLAGRILRAIVYDAEYLRAEADGLFRLAEKHRPNTTREAVPA